MPAAGYSSGYDRTAAGNTGNGYYWSSSENGSSFAWKLDFSQYTAFTGSEVRGYGMSVRAVKDPPSSASDIAANSEAGALDLRTAVTLAEGEVTIAGVGYSDTAWGEKSAENVTLGYTNETTGATGGFKADIDYSSLVLSAGIQVRF